MGLAVRFPVPVPVPTVNVTEIVDDVPLKGVMVIEPVYTLLVSEAALAPIVRFMGLPLTTEEEVGDGVSQLAEDVAVNETAVVLVVLKEILYVAGVVDPAAALRDTLLGVGVIVPVPLGGPFVSETLMVPVMPATGNVEVRVTMARYVTPLTISEVLATERYRVVPVINAPDDVTLSQLSPT